MYLPAMVLAFAALLALGLAVFTAPAFGILYLVTEQYLPGALVLVLWVPLFWAWRRFKLRRFYEGPFSSL